MWGLGKNEKDISIAEAAVKKYPIRTVKETYSYELSNEQAQAFQNRPGYREQVKAAVEDVASAIEMETKGLIIDSTSRLYEIGGNIVQYSPTRVVNYAGNRQIFNFHTHLYREELNIQNTMCGFLMGLGLTREEAQLVLSVPDIYHAEDTYPRLNDIASAIDRNAQPHNTYPYATMTALVDKQGNVMMMGVLGLTTMNQEKHNKLIKTTMNARFEMSSAQGLSENTLTEFVKTVIGNTLVWRKGTSLQQIDPRWGVFLDKATDVIAPQYTLGSFDEDTNQQLRKDGDLGGIVGGSVGLSQQGELHLVLKIDVIKQSSLYRVVPFKDIGFNRRTLNCFAEKLLGIKVEMSRDLFVQKLRQYMSSHEGLIVIPVGGEDFRVLPQQLKLNGSASVGHLDVGLVGTETSVHSSGQFLDYGASHNILHHRSKGDMAKLS